MKNFTLLYRILFIAIGMVLSTATVQAQYTGGSGKGDTVNRYQFQQSVSSNNGIYSSNFIQNNGDTIIYSADGNFDGDIDSLMVQLADAPGGNFLGSTTVLTERYATGYMNKTDRYFVPRRSRITPTTNGDAYITLYFSQADFDAYNAQAIYQLKTPLDGNDIQNFKANIRLMKTNLSVETSNLVPVSGITVTWNPIGAYWEVKAPIVGGIRGDYVLTTPFSSLLTATPITHQVQTPVMGDMTVTTTVRWKNVPGASGYHLRVRRQGDNTWTNYQETDTFKVLNGLTYSSNYEVQVRVKESTTVQSEFSGFYTFGTPHNPSQAPVCMPPINIFTSNIGPESVTINWDTVQYGISYFIYMKNAADTSWKLYGGGKSSQSNNTSFNSLTPNTTYEFRIRTTCDSGTTQNKLSLFTPIYEFTTTTPLPDCLPPDGINAQATSPSAVLIRWNPMQFVDKYYVTLIEANNPNQWVGGGTSTVGNSIEFKYLQPFTNYKYKIRSTCFNGTSSENTLSLFSDVYTFRTGIAGKQAVDDNVYYYPNPTTDMVTVDYYAKDHDDRVLSVFDLTGRLLYKQIMTSTPGRNNASVSLKGYINGMYIFQIQHGDEIQHVGRVLKQD